MSPLATLTIPSAGELVVIRFYETTKLSLQLTDRNCSRDLSTIDESDWIDINTHDDIRPVPTSARD